MREREGLEDKGEDGRGPLEPGSTGYTMRRMMMMVGGGRGGGGTTPPCSGSTLAPPLVLMAVAGRMWAMKGLSFTSSSSQMTCTA